MASWKALRGESSPGADDGETEAEFRQLRAYQYAQDSTGKATTGVLTGCQVAATTPSASGSVSVPIGLTVCQPTTSGGVFEMPVTTGTLDIFTDDPMQFESNPRNDIVIVDQTDGQIKALIGTPNATPSLGEQTVPSTAVKLARLRHLAGATTIPASAIDDLRVKISLFGAKPENKRTHWGTYSFTPDASGYATITHGAGFTPSAVVITWQGIALQCLADQFTSTTFRVREIASDGSVGPSSQQFSAFLGE